VLPSLPAIMIADIVRQCELGQDGRWRYLSHALLPIFEGGEPATIPKKLMQKVIGGLLNSTWHERISGNVLGTPPDRPASMLANATDRAGDFEFITSNTCLRVRSRLGAVATEILKSRLSGFAAGGRFATPLARPSWRIVLRIGLVTARALASRRH
jgi:hypothetical protein